jgi:hypothetical protein
MDGAVERALRRFGGDFVGRSSKPFPLDERVGKVAPPA